jgi:hypothetical protein
MIQSCRGDKTELAVLKPWQKVKKIYLSWGEKQQIFFVLQLTEQKSINYCWIQTERENTIVKSIPIT